MGGRKAEMIETIERRALPDEFSGTYSARGVWDRISNHVHEEGADKTRWIVDSEFRFTGIMRLMSVFMRG